MINYTSALFLIFIVLLMLVNFSDNFCKHCLSIQDHHASLLEISCICDDLTCVFLNNSNQFLAILSNLF